nr:hypothetical protein [Tanacetum cinerariifolium]
RKYVLEYTHVDLNKVTLDQLLSEQVPRNIVKALGGKGRRKEKISSKQVIFTKADESLSVLTLEITSDSESKCNSQEPLPPLPMLIGAAPSGTSERVISLCDLTLNIADLTLDTPDLKKTKPSVKGDSSTEQLLLTFTEEVKGLKRKIEIPTGINSSSSQSSNSKASKQKKWFGPCKHCGFRNHLSNNCYSKPKCSTCGSTNHLTKKHLEHDAVKKMLSKLKARLPLKPSPKKALVIPKPFIECKYYKFNDHHSDHCGFYPGYKVCGSIAHKESDCPKKHLNSRRPRIADRKSEPTKNANSLAGATHQLSSGNISSLAVAKYTSSGNFFWHSAYLTAGFFAVSTLSVVGLFVALSAAFTNLIAVTLGLRIIFTSSANSLAGATHQLSSGNISSLAVAKYTSSGNYFALPVGTSSGSGNFLLAVGTSSGSGKMH